MWHARASQWSFGAPGISANRHFFKARVLKKRSSFCQCKFDSEFGHQNGATLSLTLIDTAASLFVFKHLSSPAFFSSCPLAAGCRFKSRILQPLEAREEQKLPSRLAYNTTSKRPPASIPRILGREQKAEHERSGNIYKASRHEQP
jgi:hypothetical protein